VYGRRGRACRRCGTPIRSEGQQDRITFWCPSCQPG
jgi:endonuclease-8